MTIEDLQVLITANTDSLRKELQKAQKDITGLQKTANDTSSKMLKSFNMLKKGIIALGIGKIIGAQMDDAVSRLDALNNFPRVMSNLGVSNEDAQASVKRLSDALVGLPTTLDDATNSVQRFTSANGNVKASTEMFLALNNAILAGGGSAQVQSTALEQLSQAYAKGKPDMMEWRSAMTAMPAQLKQVAIAMGYASSNELGEALRSGKVSMNDFMKTMIELNKNGGNGFKSFEEQARNSTGGVGTSITNLKTAITRGLADIMNAIGQSNIAGFFNGIAKAINSVIPYIVGFVKACVTAVGVISSLFGKSTKKDVDSTTTSLKNLGSSGGSTSKGLDKATGSANKLKKALNGLSAFDEMNVLKEADSGSSGDSDSGGGADLSSGLGDIDLSGFDTGLGNVSSKADEVAQRIMEVFSTVGEVLKSIWDSEPVQAFVDFAVTYGQFLFDYWSTLAVDLWTNLQMTWSNIEGDVTTLLTNMSTLWTLFWTDMSNGIKKWGDPVIQGVSGVFNSIWKDAISPTIELITKAWADFSGILVDLWKEHGQPLIDNIGEFATKTIALFQSIWDNVIAPIVEPFLEMLSWLWDKHLKGLVKEVGDFIGELINGALEIYNKFIQPIVMWLLEKLAPVWSYLSSLVVGVLGTVLGVVTDVIGGIIKVFKGIIEFITGIFTGNWKKAWQGVKDIFKGIIDALAGIFKAPINFIIDGINAFISGLNKIKIPDWVPVVGGKGFHINKIPKLAQGGVVDKPTIAMVGEAGKEAVVPLERNTGWIDVLVSKLKDKDDGDTPTPIIIKIGEDTIFEYMADKYEEKQFETNGEVFSV
mgnify:CR=1 FL=1